MPENPPKAAEPMIRRAPIFPGTEDAIIWMPVVISTLPSRAGRSRGGI